LASEIILLLVGREAPAAVDHTPLLTAPDKVVDIILEAAKETLSQDDL